MQKKVLTQKVPSFIRKLRHILQLQDHEAEPFVRWGENNDSFQILNQVKFTQEVLPKYFKHNNLASFIRQLNIYGFTRLKNVQTLSYAHAQFTKNEDTPSGIIKRKNLERQRQMREEKKQIIQILELENEEKQLKHRCNELHKSNKVLKAENQELLKDIQEFKNMKEKMIFNGSQTKQLSQKSTDGEYTQKLNGQKSSFNFFVNGDNQQSKKAYEQLLGNGWTSNYNQGENFQIKMQENNSISHNDI